MTGGGHQLWQGSDHRASVSPSFPMDNPQCPAAFQFHPLHLVALSNGAA
jgi:hypothetical protein